MAAKKMGVESVVEVIETQNPGKGIQFMKVTLPHENLKAYGLRKKKGEVESSRVWCLVIGEPGEGGNARYLYGYTMLGVAKKALI